NFKNIALALFCVVLGSPVSASMPSADTPDDEFTLDRIKSFAQTYAERAAIYGRYRSKYEHNELLECAYENGAKAFRMLEKYYSAIDQFKQEQAKAAGTTQPGSEGSAAGQAHAINLVRIELDKQNKMHEELIALKLRL